MIFVTSFNSSKKERRTGTERRAADRRKGALSAFNSAAKTDSLCAFEKRSIGERRSGIDRRKP